MRPRPALETGAILAERTYKKTEIEILLEIRSCPKETLSAVSLTADRLPADKILLFYVRLRV
jgi:hypothetical protein